MWAAGTTYGEVGAFPDQPSALAQILDP